LNKTVLFVDDNTDLQTVFSIGLAPHGFQVTTCGTAAAALEAIQSTRFDFAIIDLDLGDRDGGETGLKLGNRIRQHPHGDATRMILLSGQQNEHLVANALEAGFEAYFVKPSRMKQLLEKLCSPD